MSLSPVDWLFIVWYLILAIGIGIYFSKKAGRSLSDFFISGRNLPWWIIGTSMVATSFAADTPLAVTGIVIKDGISGNWFWWNFLFGGTLTVFFFSHLWRRAEVLTEVEFIDIRYSGSSAKFLRGFKALYLGIPVSSIFFGWITLAMVQVFRIVFQISEVHALIICLLITIIYTTLSGLWGVVTTDILQFCMAVVGAIVLSLVSVEKVGGISSFMNSLRSLSSQTGIDYLSTLPSFKESIPLAFIVALFVQWWAVYYPGAEPGGGGWVVQRMLAARNPKHSVLGTLWFNIAHYVIRPWPWIITALAAIILYPELLSSAAGNVESAYPRMIGLLPSGIKGLMIASFLAAYMSTIDSILTLSASYLVNDFYKPFLKKKASDKHYVAISRMAIIVVALSGAAFSYLIGSVKMGWALIMELSGGIGLVLLLRWYWWRINAWSEISAILASGSMAIYLKIFPNSPLFLAVQTFFQQLGFQTSPWGVNIICIVLFTTSAWITVTLLTPPDRKEKLKAFYEKVRPGGFWSVAAEDKGKLKSLGFHPFLGWFLSILVILFFLQGIGKLIFMHWTEGMLFLLGGIISGFFLLKLLKKIDREVG
ncbi:MAG: sodium:proline symporter [Candidatus Aminicenantes bacterium]|nr:sodium:proline symporter [Candidatus Aminicenantes bacterium]